MGPGNGIPHWLLGAIFVAILFLIIGLIAWRRTKRQLNATLVKRANPTRSEFLAMMETEVSQGAADFLWQAAVPCLVFFKPELTPHPDDHLIDDLPIDEEEWSMGWPREWADRQGFHHSNLPDWPQDWPVTVRNFGRWLDMGPQ